MATKTVRLTEAYAKQGVRLPVLRDGAVRLERIKGDGEPRECPVGDEAHYDLSGRDRVEEALARGYVEEVKAPGRSGTAPTKPDDGE